MATRKEITQVMAFLASFWPNSVEARAVDDPAQADRLRRYVDAWHAVVGDLPAEDLMLAARHLASQPREFFPPAGVVRSTFFELQEDGNGDVPSPVEAWGQVEKLLSLPVAWRNGPVHPSVQGEVEQIHPLTREAVEAMGGLHRLGQEPVDMVASTRARFVQVYEVILARKRRDAQMLPDVREAIGLLGEGPGSGVMGEIKKLAAKFSW